MSITMDHGESPARPWIAGTCAGIARLSGIRPWIIRTGAVLLLMLHPPLMLLAYAGGAVLLRRGGMPGRPGWFGRSWRLSRRMPRPRAPKSPSPLAGLGGRLAALDRRLDALEAAMSGETGWDGPPRR